MWWYAWIFYVLRIFEWIQRPFNAGMKLIGNPGQRVEATKWIGYEERKTVNEPRIEEYDDDDDEVIILEHFDLPPNDGDTSKAKDTAMLFVNEAERLIAMLTTLSKSYLRLLVYGGLTLILFKSMTFLARRFKNKHERYVSQTLQVQVFTEFLHYHMDPMFHMYLRQFCGAQWATQKALEKAVLDIALFENDQGSNIIRISFAKNEIYMNSMCLYQIENLVRIFCMLTTENPSIEAGTNPGSEVAVYNANNSQGWWVENDNLTDEYLVEEDESTEVNESTEELDFADSETISSKSSSSDTSSSETLKPPESIEELMADVMGFEKLVTQEDQDQLIDLSNLSVEEIQNNIDKVGLLLYYPDGSPCILDCQVINGI